MLIDEDYQHGFAAHVKSVLHGLRRNISDRLSVEDVRYEAVKFGPVKDVYVSERSLWPVAQMKDLRKRLRRRACKLDGYNRRACSVFM